MKYFTTLLLLTTLSVLSQSTLKTKAYKETIEISQWEVVDITFKANNTAKNPFLVEFGALFTNDNNESLKIPGFYNGNKEWVIRFSNKNTGSWRFSTFASIKKLNKLKGSVTVTKNTNTNKHGGVVINPKNPQHFSYEDGTDYFAMAFECDWLFALDYDDTTATPKTEHLLNTLKKNNLNQIVTTVYSFDVGWEKDEKLQQYPEHEYGGKLDIFPFLGTNETPDYSSLNVEFFKKFDRTVALMDQNDIIAHIMIYVWNKEVNWPDTESEADNMYFDYIIKRYQAFPNIIWDVSKEALNNPRCTEAYGRERIERIESLDAFNRLITVHDYGFCVRNTDVVDFISTQNWSATLYNTMLDVREKFKSKPIFNIEHGGYESSYYEVFPGDYTNPELCLRRNYLCAFAGTYSTYYWQGAAWNVIMHQPFEMDEIFPKPKFHYYKNLVDFFSTYNFSEFQPAPQHNNSAYCLENKSGTYLMYVPKENEKLSVYWKSPLAKKTGTYQWYNVFTGIYSEVFDYSGNHFKSPWKDQADAILIRKL